MKIFDLPDEIIEEIMDYLDIDTIVSLRHTCRQFFRVCPYMKNIKSNYYIGQNLARLDKVFFTSEGTDYMTVKHSKIKTIWRIPEVYNIHLMLDRHVFLDVKMGDITFKSIRDYYFTLENNYVYIIDAYLNLYRLEVRYDEIGEEDLYGYKKKVNIIYNYIYFLLISI